MAIDTRKERIMSNNKQNNIPQISREQRIKLRAERYIKGELSLDEFASLERLDETVEEPGLEAIIKKNKVQAERLREIHQEEQAKEKALEAARAAKRKKLKITKEEFDKLRLNEQQALYNEHPDEVKALIGKG